MATITATQRNDKNYPHSQMVLDAPTKQLSATFSAADAAKLKGSALAANDVVELLSIPAGAFVLTVTHKVVTVEGGTFTYSIGDGATASGYVSAANGNTAANGTSFNGTTTPAFGVGKFYATADTIDMTIASGAPAIAVVTISAAYILTTPTLT
jgi:hypothetical protein